VGEGYFLLVIEYKSESGLFVVKTDLLLRVGV
jgi:hypothetical protein